MRVFKKFNDHGDTPCPICGTQDPKEVVLVVLDGTQQGRISEGVQVHLDCLELRMFKNDDYSLIYHKID